MSTDAVPPAPTLPAVDHPQVAAALAELADLDDRPLDEHHDRLGRVHEVLHAVLHPQQDGR